MSGMRFLILVFLLFCTCLSGRNGPPNFLVIYMDDLGWADTSVPMMDSEPDSRSDFYRTPNLEKLAARGMRFSNGYSPAPTCTPSRKSIQFGKTPARLGYTFVHDVLAIKRDLSWAEEVSLADVVKASGQNYVTAHFGKGMGKEQMKTIGYDFHDEFDGRSPNGNFHGDYVDLKSRRRLPSDDPKRIYSLTSRSVDFLKKHAGKRPFLLMVSHYAVHVPHMASPEVIERYRKLPRGKHLKDADYLPADKISKAQKISSWRLQYAAMIDEVDTGMGKMIEVLENNDELGNTYIVYTSDNGGGLGPNGPLSWGKAQLFEGGLRVPWVIAGPGVKPRSQCDVPVVQWDLLPTFHDLCGSKAPLPKNLDGGSLRNVLENGNEGKVVRPVEGLVFHYPCYFAPPLSVIRLGDYKLMRHLLTGERRLYNLLEDPAEKTNLIRTMTAKANHMDTVLKAYLADIKAEEVQDVYKARLEELDLFESRAEQVFNKKTKGLDPTEDAERLGELQAKLKADRERFARNRVEVEINRKSSHWAGSPPQRN